MPKDMDQAVINTLSDEWRAAGVSEGDMLLIHSNIRRTLRRIAKLGADVSVELIINSFLSAIGETGTLLFPLFNFDFPKGITFDIRITKSQMGSFTEAGRLWPGAVRTGHPIYSFAAIGKEKELFQGLTNFSGYGADSPFGIIHRKNGKIGVLDLPDQKSMTFYHYVEESLNVPYRHHKTFSGQYIDEYGNESTRSFGLYVRNIEQGITTHVDPMGEILWEKEIYKGCSPNEGCGLRTISAPSLFDEVSKVIGQGKAKGILYEIAKR